MRQDEKMENQKKGPQFHVRKSFASVEELSMLLSDVVALLEAKGTVGLRGEGKLSFIKGKPLLLDMHGEYDKDIARLHIHVEQVMDRPGVEEKAEIIELEG